MEPSNALASASMAVPVIVLYRSGRIAAPRGHEIDTLRELARQIAALKGTQFAGEIDESCAPPTHCYLIADDTLTLVEAGKLGVGSAHDLYGGVVPCAVAATKLIAHGLLVGGKSSPPGWSDQFSARTASLVLPGYSVFSRADARRAAHLLLDGGRVRIKRADGTGGAGQELVASREQLEVVLDALDDQVLRAAGIVVERHLSTVETISVGQVLFGDIVASYHGVQHLTVNNHGHEVYGGTDLTVVRGGFDSLMNLELSDGAREAIAKARAFDAAVQSNYAGFFASRRNYDVARGLDDAGVQHCGVLEQSWRVGGATGAEIGALRIFSAEPEAQVVHASTRELYGHGVQVPEGARLVYRGVDARVGEITKFYTAESGSIPGGNCA
ncbi:DUF3182 family protein [Ralstonia soli]|uniref:DUF3182 family protein n=1 Tax=Ralstonia soli TaxID=2953896 RepID=A0ABT1AL01_9RALS|nr:DUF3182 family protein [Ralstonia soli]MCO5399105.1 DUF3182 family protein [Ralstonia soli]